MKYRQRVLLENLSAETHSTNKKRAPKWVLFFWSECRDSFAFCPVWHKIIVRLRRAVGGNACPHCNGSFESQLRENTDNHKAGCRYFGRSVGIRTRGLLDPNQARYQTSPHPDKPSHYKENMDDCQDLPYRACSSTKGISPMLYT